RGIAGCLQPIGAGPSGGAGADLCAGTLIPRTGENAGDPGWHSQKPAEQRETRPSCLTSAERGGGAMRPENSREGNHLVALLPAYLNNTLDDQRAGQVRAHLSRCADCQAELAAWEAVQSATLAVAASVPVPSLALLDDVWETLDVSAPAQHPWRQAALRR